VSGTGAKVVPFSSRMMQRIDAVLGALLEPGRPVALVNYPNHQNPGDNAIWLGAQATLARLNVPVGYTSDWSAFSEAAMRRAIGSGTLLLNGGGNFGDVYAGQQQLREHVLERCTDRRVIQLPQSIWFRSRAGVERLRRLCASHPDFILLVREQQSHRLAGRWFDAPAILCPDMAFGLGPLARPAGARQPLLWLGRHDAEAVARTVPAGVPLRDWITADASAGMSAAERRILQLNRKLVRFVAGDRGRTERRGRALAATFGPLAAAWVRRGIEIVSSADIVITDRLHAHVFAILLGIPHVVLDNSYGKVRSTFDTWTSECGLAAWANDGGAALRSAFHLARAPVQFRR
jgi:exopolysaccharide biosynthesis predicted pyruvyltransferase EpsI